MTTAVDPTDGLSKITLDSLEELDLLFSDTLLSDCNGSIVTNLA